MSEKEPFFIQNHKWWTPGALSWELESEAHGPFPREIHTRFRVDDWVEDDKFFSVAEHLPWSSEHHSGSLYDFIKNRFTSALIPEELSLDLYQTISRAQEILKLEDDWDEEGSPGYKPDTLDLAIDFLQRSADAYWSRSGVWIPAPQIQPGPAASIDIHWRLDQRELLVNIQEDSPRKATFYGDHRNDFPIKGEIDLEGDTEWLMLWLMK